MRTPSKKLIALILLWAAVLVFQAVMIVEGKRMAAARQQLLEEQIELGAHLYGQNCMICHGPLGEGVVGPPLNRPDYRTEGLSQLEAEAIRRELTDTIARGRGGTDTPLWVFHPDGTIESHTRMPTFGKADGGPLNEQQIEALVTFITAGEWSKTGGTQPPARLTKTVNDPASNESKEVPITFEDLPQAAGVSPDINDRGRQLFIDRSCIQCHTLGDYGGFIGPNLSTVGDWTTPDFLRRWLTNPEGTIPRMPTVFLGNGVRKEREVDWTGMHKTQMPNPIEDLKATPEEIEILVQYLSGLKSLSGQGQ